eukprot:GEMP01007583.1.p1 GENE.GEMP01007583.1~~GEMP01007583.1.p1  ORF type:complete len:907 (+),score=176.46 GEMP01007583.1:57-2777(+)
MRFRYYYEVSCVLLWTQCVIRASEVRQNAYQQPASSGFATGGDGRNVAPYANAQPGGSGFAIGVDERDFARHADDIYSQSGGVRVHYGKDLTPAGREVVRQFMVNERKAQRAFLWRKLGIEDIHFVHRGATSPAVAVAQPKDIAQYSNDELRDTYASAGVTLGSREATIDNFRDLQLYLSLGDNNNHRLTFDTMRNVAWNFDHVHLFIDTMLNRPRYNDMPGSIGPDVDLVGHFALMDPRYRDNDAVVNYRANARTLVLERLALFRSLQPNLQINRDDVMMMLMNLKSITTRVYRAGLDNLFILIREEHTREREHGLAFEVNVDAFGAVPIEDMYGTISQALDAQIEGIATQHVGYVDAATTVLQEIMNEETRTAMKYVKFVDNAWRGVQQVNLNSLDPMVNNIEQVYRRALYRRQAFHKMTIPFVPFSDGMTYRVHFTDPENRYVTRENEIVAKRSIEWYKAMWTRFVEPILKNVIIPEIRESPFRDIVLGHFNPDVNKDGTAYTTTFGEVIVDCTSFDTNHNMAERALRHEYEHTVDYATELRTRTLYEEMLNEHDLTTYTMNDLEWSDKSEDVVSAYKNVWRERLDSTQYTANVDNDGGFVSPYAQTDSAETVAEQRTIMRTEPMRIALLQRMSAHKTDNGAMRQKAFYDKARQVMRNVAPQLHAEWGTYYDNCAESHWGVSKGARRKTKRQYAILEFDHSRATKMAAENLATRYLLQGDGVTIMAYHEKKIPIPRCRLQSNLVDSRSRTSILHVVLSSKIDLDARIVADGIFSVFLEFTHTGRSRTNQDPNKYFDEVSFVLPKGETSNAENEQFLTEFVDALRTETEMSSDSDTDSLHNYDAMDVDAPRPKVEIFADTSIWPADKNLLRPSIFAGWYEGGTAVWGPADLEEFTIQQTKGLCV